ncbi:MAG: HAMP domain-containing protein [Nitrospirae bacterium]|nr:MAG: HAMP domain-containing protein [Nitrospirota bacterium]
MMRSMRRWFLNRSLTSKLVLIFSLPFLFLVVVTIITLRTYQEVEKADELAKRSSQIRSQAIYYMDLLDSIQSEFRGYLLTGDRSFLVPYVESKGDIDLAGLELARLVQDSPSQAQRDRTAKAQAITRRLIQEKEWVLAHERSLEEGVSYVKSGRGRELANAISSLLVEIEEEASQIHETRQEAVDRKRDLLLNVIVGGTLLTLLLTGLGAIVVARSVTRPMSSLAQAALEIGESRYAAFPDADRQDEVGILSRSMEEMQRRLFPAERLAALARIATSIAHDLRTPLLGIEQGLQGLKYFTDSQLSGEARQLVGDLHNGARLAVGIVQDILDLYRQAYGELPLSYSRFRLDQVVREVVDLVKPEIADRRLNVAIQAPPAEITGDQRRLYRVLVNLLDNAVKNSPSGGNVQIIVSVRDKEAARRAVVAVEDEGKGLDPATLDTLFEANRPVSAPTRMGTGLGLYLCRIVIAAHRGTIWAENRSEGGARFVFDIPAEGTHVDQVADRGRPTSVPTKSAHRS